MSIRKKSVVSVLLSLCMVVALLFLAPVQARADLQIDKALCSLNFEPVVWMELQYVNVTSSSTDCSIAQSYWVDSVGSIVSGRFEKGNYTLVVTYAAAPGHIFSPNALGYVNGKNDGVSLAVAADGASATLRKTYSATIWTPTNIKDPVATPVEAGGWLSLAVSSIYAESHEWYLESPDGSQRFPVSSSNGTFPTLTYTGETTERLNLHNIPWELDGWKVYCTHWSVDHLTSANSGKATLKVNGQPVPTAEIRPVATPMPEEPVLPETPDGGEQAPEPLQPEATALPAETPEPVHVHNYGDWNSDSSSHWRVCADCGETERGEHRFVWHETRAATGDADGEETGVCSFCGYSIKRSVPYAGTRGQEILGYEISRPALYVLAAAGGSLLLLLLLAFVSPKRRRRR